jgi:hypothetical protein
MESLQSGARAQAIECGESQNVEAFRSRLAETEHAWAREEQATSRNAGTASPERILNQNLHFRGDS